MGTDRGGTSGPGFCAAAAGGNSGTGIRHPELRPHLQGTPIALQPVNVDRVNRARPARPENGHMAARAHTGDAGADAAAARPADALGAAVAAGTTLQAAVCTERVVLKSHFTFLEGPIWGHSVHARGAAKSRKKFGVLSRGACLRARLRSDWPPCPA